MTIYDLSVPLRNGMPFYPGDPEPRITRLADHERGDDWTISFLAVSAHLGTHVDAPLHRIRKGKAIDRLDLHTLIGRAFVADLTGVASEITANALQARNIPAAAKRLVFKTRNHMLWARQGFQTEYVALSRDGAEWLVQRGVRLVGFDYLSSDVYSDQAFPVHDTLLRAGVVIVEGLMTGEVPPGWHTLVCLPLRLQEGDGAPARAVLLSGTASLDTEEEQ